MSGRSFRTFLMVAGAIIALAVVFHLFGGGAMRSLGQLLHGR